MARTTSRSSGKKKAAGIVAATLVVALLLGGAFAWTDFGQNFINRFKGGADPDVILHDDFEAGVNKDVYAENSGKAPTVVRIQFAEYLQIGNKPVVGKDAKNPKTWEVRKFYGDMVPDADGFLPSKNHHIWEMSGAAKIYKPGVGQMGNYTYKNGQKFEDGTVAKSTLAKAPVMLMKDWVTLNAATRETTVCWILDEDGWCYWSQLLQPDTATNLLLDDVKLDEKDMPDDNYAYNIDVRLQASNKTEIDDMIKKGSTINGKNLMEYLAKGILKDTDGNTYTPNGDGSYTCTDKDGNETIVYPDGNGGWIKEGDRFVDADGNVWVKDGDSDGTGKPWVNTNDTSDPKERATEEEILRKNAAVLRKKAEAVKEAINRGEYGAEGSVGRTNAENAVKSYEDAATILETKKLNKNNINKANLNEQAGDAYLNAAEAAKTRDDFSDDKATSGYLENNSIEAAEKNLAVAKLAKANNTNKDANSIMAKYLAAAEANLKGVIEFNKSDKSLKTHYELVTPSIRALNLYKAWANELTKATPDATKLAAYKGIEENYLPKIASSLKEENGVVNKASFYATVTSHLTTNPSRYNADCLVFEDIALVKYPDTHVNKGKYWILAAVCPANGQYTVPTEYTDSNTGDKFKTIALAGDFFAQNNRITKLTVPAGIIQLSGLTQCPNLTTVDLSKSDVTTVTSFINENNAYYPATKLKTITLPKTVTSISSSFAGMKGLTINYPSTLTVPDAVKTKSEAKWVSYTPAP